MSLGIVVTVREGPLIGHAERLPSRNDGDPVDRIRARHNKSQDGMPALVIRHAFLGGS